MNGTNERQIVVDVRPMPVQSWGWAFDDCLDCFGGGHGIAKTLDIVRKAMGDGETNCNNADGREIA